MKCLAGHPLGVGTVSDAGGSRSLLQHGDHDSEIHDVQKRETTATKTGRDHPVRPTERPSRGLPTGGGRCVRDSGRNCRPSPRRERPLTSGSLLRGVWPCKPRRGVIRPVRPGHPPQHLSQSTEASCHQLRHGSS